MSIPNSEHLIDYGQTSPRFPATLPHFATGGYVHGLQEPADSISISLEFLRGVKAAFQAAEDEEYLVALDTITLQNVAYANEVARLQREVTK